MRYGDWFGFWKESGRVLFFCGDSGRRSDGVIGGLFVFFRERVEYFCEL